jgi:hypothetical protein
VCRRLVRFSVRIAPPYSHIGADELFGSDSTILEELDRRRCPSLLASMLPHPTCPDGKWAGTVSHSCREIPFRLANAGLCSGPATVHLGSDHGAIRMSPDIPQYRSNVQSGSALKTISGVFAIAGPRRCGP